MYEKVHEYNNEAEVYDKSRFFSICGKHLDYMHKRIIRSLLNSSGGTILEAGVGTGRFSVWLSEKGFEVVGIDISKEMLKQAKRKIQSSNVLLNLVLGDVHFLPFKKGIFDNCICINVVNHITDIDQFLKEVKYVIDSKGFFIVNFPNLQSLYLPIAIIVNLRKRALFKKRKIYSKWFIPTKIKFLLSSAGFTIKEIRGCAISTPLPFGDKLVKVIQKINFSIESSRVKLVSGSLFCKAYLAHSRAE